MEREILYTAALSISRHVEMPSCPVMVTNLPHSQMEVGDVTRDSAFDIAIPGYQLHFFTPEGKHYVKRFLQPSPGISAPDAVACWQRQK